jgi:hypothetical protein
LAGDLVAKSGIMTAYLAGQIRDSQAADPSVPPADAELAAAGLLAMVEGLIAQTLIGRHTPRSAQAVLAAALDLVFGARVGTD